VYTSGLNSLNSLNLPAIEHTNTHTHTRLIIVLLRTTERRTSVSHTLQHKNS